MIPAPSQAAKVTVYESRDADTNKYKYTLEVDDTYNAGWAAMDLNLLKSLIDRLNDLESR